VSRVIYGIHPVLEAIKAAPDSIERAFIAEGRQGWAVGEVIEALSAADIPWEHVPRKEVAQFAGTEKHQGVVARVAEFSYSSLETLLAVRREGRLFLVLDGIQDPQNLGSLIRSGNGAGVDGVIIPKRRAAAVTPAVVKASAGAAEVTPVVQVTNIVTALERLKDEHIWVIGIEAASTVTIYDADLSGNLAVVIGSEGGGMRRLVRERCDSLLAIPMAGAISSLNASIAGAVTLFEVCRQRRASPQLP